MARPAPFLDCCAVDNVRHLPTAASTAEPVSSGGTVGRVLAARGLPYHRGLEVRGERVGSVRTCGSTETGTPTGSSICTSGWYLQWYSAWTGRPGRGLGEDEHMASSRESEFRQLAETLPDLRVRQVGVAVSHSASRTLSEALVETLADRLFGWLFDRHAVRVPPKAVPPSPVSSRPGLSWVGGHEPTPPDADARSVSHPGTVAGRPRASGRQGRMGGSVGRVRGLRRNPGGVAGQVGYERRLSSDLGGGTTNERVRAPSANTGKVRRDDLPGWSCRPVRWTVPMPLLGCQRRQWRITYDRRP